MPPAADPGSAAAPSDRLWLRSELMGTQVITRDTGRRLGVVGEVVVDLDRREVVALGLRDNPLTRFLPGLPRWMPLDQIRQVGDVILVESADSLAEGFNPERYSKVINCQVVTEAGEQLGRVLGFSFDIETGELTTLVLGALGVPLLGEGVLSTWELPVEEVVSSGPDRIIVYEGSEEKLKQLGTGLLEKLGVGGPSWEQEERDRYRSTMVPVENQLAAGTPSRQEQRQIQPSTARALERDEDYDYVELEERRQQEPLRQRRYLDEERGDRYDDRRGRSDEPRGRFEDGRDDEVRGRSPRYDAPRDRYDDRPVGRELDEPDSVERRYGRDSRLDSPPEEARSRNIRSLDPIDADDLPLEARNPIRRRDEQRDRDPIEGSERDPRPAPQTRRPLDVDDPW